MTTRRPCLTIHAGPGTSRDLWDRPDHEVVAGDAVGEGGRVEGAATSAVAEVAHLVQALGLA